VTGNLRTLKAAQCAIDVASDTLNHSEILEVRRFRCKRKNRVRLALSRSDGWKFE
jgi:hypothetical protein